MRRLLCLCLLLLWNTEAWAACTNTSNLTLCKLAFGDTNWHTETNSNLDKIDLEFSATTGAGGHGHTGVAGDAPKISVTTGLSVDIATQAELDTHKTSGDHDSRYPSVTGATFTGALLVANGTKAAPSLALSFDTDAGWYTDGSTTTAWIYSAGNEDTLAIRGGSGSGINFEKDWGFGWTSTGNPTVTPDAEVWRDSAGIIAFRGKSQTSNVRGGTDAAPVPYALTVYNYNDIAIPAYERLYVGFDGTNNAYIEVQDSGTGSDDNALHIRTGGAADLNFGTSGASRWKLDASTSAFLPVTDESYKIGNGTLDPLELTTFTTRIKGKNGAFSTTTTKTEQITLSTSGTITDGSITIPQYAVIRSIDTRVTTTITGSGVVGFVVEPKINGTECQSAVSIALTSGTTDKGTRCAGTRITDSAEKARVTAIGGTPTAGVIRVVVTYDEEIAPTA